MYVYEQLTWKKVINGLAKPKILSAYDPETAPIGEYENRFLVYFFAFIANSINEKVSLISTFSFSLSRCIINFISPHTVRQWIRGRLQSTRLGGPRGQEVFVRTSWRRRLIVVVVVVVARSKQTGRQETSHLRRGGQLCQAARQPATTRLLQVHLLLFALPRSRQTSHRLLLLFGVRYRLVFLHILLTIRKEIKSLIIFVVALVVKNL